MKVASNSGPHPGWLTLNANWAKKLVQWTLVFKSASTQLEHVVRATKPETGLSLIASADRSALWTRHHRLLSLLMQTMHCLWISVPPKTCEQLDCPKKTAWSNIVSLQGKRTSPGRHRTMCSPPGSYCSTELSSVELGLLKTRATCNLLLPIGICIPGQHEKELTQWVPFGWCLQSQISVDFPYETKFCVSYDITL